MLHRRLTRRCLYAGLAVVALPLFASCTVKVYTDGEPSATASAYATSEVTPQLPSGPRVIPSVEPGGGRYHTNTILATKPHEAVRGIYDAIAKGVDPRYVCGSFDRPARRAFAVHVGYENCQQAVRDLQTQVTNVNAYAESVPSTVSQPIASDTVRVRSCDFDISGGPALGTFVVSKVERGGWLITEHRAGPRVCPA